VLAATAVAALSLAPLATPSASAAGSHGEKPGTGQKLKETSLFTDGQYCPDDPGQPEVTFLSPGCIFLERGAGGVPEVYGPNVSFDGVDDQGYYFSFLPVGSSKKIQLFVPVDRQLPAKILSGLPFVEVPLTGQIVAIAENTTQSLGDTELTVQRLYPPSGGDVQGAADIMVRTIAGLQQRTVTIGDKITFSRGTAWFTGTVIDISSTTRSVVLHLVPLASLQEPTNPNGSSKSALESEAGSILGELQLAILNAGRL
jgi:hypothetical protein